MDKFIYKYAAVIGIDGMGAFNKHARTPNLDRIFSHGATTYTALSMDPTISAENWGAMLLGADPAVHGLTNSIVGRIQYENDELPSLFKRIREKYPNEYLTSICNWNPINNGIIEHNIGVDMATGDNDEALCPIIEEKISKRPKFLFVQFDDVDGAGHGNWYGTDGHIKQIEKTDNYVERIYRAYEKTGILDETLFIVIADHGGFRGGHGGYRDSEKYVFLGVAGKGIEKTKIPNAKTVDISAIVLYSLGIEIPQYSPWGFSSQIPQNIFPWCKEKYICTKPKSDIIKSKPTPEYNGDNGLTRYFDNDEIGLCLFFDDCIKDEAHHCKLTEKGLVKYYSQGVFGARGELGKTGHIKVDGLNLSSKGFSISVWLMVDPSITEEVVVLANKSWWWRDREESGMALALRCADVVLNISDNPNSLELVVPFHEQVSKGFVHIIFSVDFENREIRAYRNFEFAKKINIPDEIDFEAKSSVYMVGNDITEKYNSEIYPLLINMDDLIVINHSLDKDGVEKIKKYYEV